MSDDDAVMSVDFYFDPVCPWTWLTARWLVEVAEERSIDVDWRSLSLSVLNAGSDIPEEYRAPMDASAQLHRAIAAMRADGRVDLVGDVYTEFGRRHFHDQEPATVALAREALSTAGASAYESALDDASWDDAVAASTHEAISLAGPDVGSPIISLGEQGVAFFGPIVSPPPTGDDALALFDQVVAFASIPGVFEVKRGRTAPPVFGPRP